MGEWKYSAVYFQSGNEWRQVWSVRSWQRYSRRNKGTSVLVATVSGAEWTPGSVRKLWANLSVSARVLYYNVQV